jgi:hypothetical protein
MRRAGTKCGNGEILQYSSDLTELPRPLDKGTALAIAVFAPRMRQCFILAFLCSSSLIQGAQKRLLAPVAIFITAWEASPARKLRGRTAMSAEAWGGTQVEAHEDLVTLRTCF